MRQEDKKPVFSIAENGFLTLEKCDAPHPLRFPIRFAQGLRAMGAFGARRSL